MRMALSMWRCIRPCVTLKGNMLSDKTVGHIFRIEGGLIKRFDIR
jgi:hypothetical protein